MSYGNNNYYKKGSWNVICDVCGTRHKSDQVRKRWDGLIVCEDDWEPDHPQKYLRVYPDGQPVSPIRSEPADTFIHICYLSSTSGYTGLATADCAVADYQPRPYGDLA